MFDKILVPLDGSEEAESTFPYLRDLAPRFDSQVDILGVGIGGKRRRLNRILRGYLEEVATTFQGSGIKAKSVLLFGNPADEILDHAEQNDTDLIIMSTRGRSGFTRWWIGSVAEKIISGSSSPVLLVRNKRPREANAIKESPFMKILAPLDGSDIGEAALLHIEELALRTKALVSLIQVIPQPGTIEANVFRSTGGDIVAAVRSASEDYLGNVAKRLGERGIKTTHEVIIGDPADKLVEYAEDKDIGLIAMSTHGRSGVARWMLGSVADKVLHGAKVPVWLVRSPRMICPELKT